MYEQITDQEATTRDGAQVRCKRTGRRTDADACSLRRAKGEAGRRCCRTHSGVPRDSASLLENLHRKAMEQKGGGEQREKRPESVRQHFVLSTRDAFFFLVLLLL